MIAEPIIRRLTLARYFYRLADDNARFGREASIFAAINLLQDSVEFFLIAASEHLNADIKANTPFEQYLDKIDSNIAPKKLPFRAKLFQLNKIRVNSKHYGVRPDTSEVKGHLVAAREFFEEATPTIFGVNFWTVSLIDLLSNGAAKTHLHLAQEAFESGDYRVTLVECRKAFFSTFEYRFNLKPFENREGHEPYGALFAFMNASPYYARNKAYISENVSEPFDYILLDRELIERELTSNGIDHATFWNIERLTPAVYRSEYGGEWLVKNDLYVFDQNGIGDRASYVLESTIDVLVTMRLRMGSVRGLSHDTNYFVDLKRDEVTLYTKADRTSGVRMKTPKGLTRLNVKSSTEGLKGDGTYWSVYQSIGEDPISAGSTILWGYVWQDDVDLD